MKYIIEWKQRPADEYDDHIENGEALVRAFSKWEPPEALTIGLFVSRVDSTGGFVEVETDDAAALGRFVSDFSAWNDTEVHLVIDIAEGVTIFSESLAWAKQAADDD